MANVTDLRQQTIDTYNKSAIALAEYFRGIGSRTTDIDKAFALCGEPKSAQVVEIGCGDGRDAKEIVKRAGWFLGFDVSEELIKLARELVPTGKFEVADATKFTFPENLDIVFALRRCFTWIKPKLSKCYEQSIKHFDQAACSTFL